jgi:predicted acylesterase/phospholipase RssA
LTHKIALCLPGGGANGALFQLGAVSALEDSIERLEASNFDLYVASSGGASVAAALASGLPVQRLYRAFVDPADVYFGLERKHLLRIDLGEWRRALPALFGAMREAAGGIVARGAGVPTPALWQELDRLYDALPAGIFTLEGYEKFLEDFFVRRGVPNNFFALPKPLRILAHDLDSAEPTVFGAGSSANVPIARACIASMAIPPLFSPVQVGERSFINPGAGQVVHLDVAMAEGATVLVVVNPMVPMQLNDPPPSTRGEVPRARGMPWIVNQAIRIGATRGIREQCRRAEASGAASVLLIEPESDQSVMFLGNPSSPESRRRVLEYAYKRTRAVLASSEEALSRAGLLLRPPRTEPPRSRV